jgi:hypothetical protein
LAKLSDGRVAMARGDVDAAIAAFEGARSDLKGEQRPVLESVITLELGAALARAGRTAAATQQARAALISFRQLGLPAEVARASALLHSLES